MVRNEVLALGLALGFRILFRCSAHPAGPIELRFSELGFLSFGIMGAGGWLVGGWLVLGCWSLVVAPVPAFGRVVKGLLVSVPWVLAVG